MSQFYRIVHTDRATSTTTDITGAVDIRENDGIETKIDSFSFRVMERDLNNLEIQLEDSIKIYFGASPTPTTIVMDGLITEMDYSVSEKGRAYIIRGQNKLEAIMNNQIPAPFGDTGVFTRDPPSIISYLIDQTNELNSERDGWVNIGKSIASTRSDSSAFPTIEYNQPWASIFQHIEKLSQDEYTNDGTYIYYLDTDNVFNWEARPTTVSDNITEGNTIKIKITKGTWDTTNALIIHCGDDNNSRSVYTYAFNLTSIGKLGFKWKYVPRVDIGKNLKAQHPEYDNNTLRDEMRKEGKKQGQQIVDKLGGPRYKAEVDLRGTTGYTKGGLYTLNMNTFVFSNGNNNYNLRLVDITQNYNGNAGWVTTLHLEEDEETALVNIT